jgi:transcriptional regulator with XRE-family HTH domain
MGKRRPAQDVRERFGDAVRARRDELGLTQEELAHRAGIHRTYLSDVERGARNVSLVNIEALAAALGVPMAELFRVVDPE